MIIGAALIGFVAAAIVAAALRKRKGLNNKENGENVDG